VPTSHIGDLVGCLLKGVSVHFNNFVYTFYTHLTPKMMYRLYLSQIQHLVPPVQYCH